MKKLRSIGSKILLVIIIIAWYFLRGGTLTGNVEVRDGDSLVVNSQKVRLLGIDAPELAQTCERSGKEWDCGREAKRYAEQLIGANQVRCDYTDNDRYERLLGTCYAGEVNINRELVRNGFAISLSHIGMYSKEEVEAKKAKRGIWAGTFLEPWEYREKYMKR